MAYLHDPGTGVPVGKYLADDEGKLMFRVDPGIAGTYPKKLVPATFAGVTLPLEAGGKALGPDRKPYTRIVVEKQKAGDKAVALPDGVYLADDTGAVRFEEKAVTKFDAPQARLMNMIIDGILTRKLPWGFVLIGVFIAIVLKLCGVSPLPFAVGAYLPVSTSTPIFVGGLIRWWVDRKSHAEGMEAEFSPGVLLSSGYIAGRRALRPARGGAHGQGLGRQDRPLHPHGVARRRQLAGLRDVRGALGNPAVGLHPRREGHGPRC